MAWAAVGSLGTINDPNFDSTLALTTSATLEVGNVAIVLVAVDNKTTTDGNSSDIVSMTDSAGNTYTKCREYTNGEGTQANGASVAIFRTVATSQLTSGGTITVTFIASLAGRCMSAYEFTKTAGTTLSVEGTADKADDATTPGSMAISSLASAEYLFVRALASESNDTTALTASASWTAFSQDVADAGISDESMAIRGEFRILTATGATSAPTLAVTADHASTMVAILETAPASGTATAQLLTLFGVGG